MQQTNFQTTRGANAISVIISQYRTGSPFKWQKNYSEHFLLQVQDFLESHLNQLGEEVASLQHGVQVKDEKCSSHSGALSLFQVFGKNFPVSKFSWPKTILFEHTSLFSGASLFGQKKPATACWQLLQVPLKTKDRDRKGLDRTVRI